MTRKIAAALATLICLAMVTTPATAKQKAPKTKRVVVLVSGTAATTPFTTPKHACKTGFSAGNTWEFIREDLTDRGYKVFTAPASINGVKVKETSSENDGPFGKCPDQLAAKMTINSVGPVDRSASSLARFLKYLNKNYGVTNVDLVGHSLGGFIGRAGIREVELNKIPVTFNSYATLGSPWTGTYMAAPPDPADPMSACHGFPVCEAFIGPLMQVPGIDMLIAMLNPKNTPTWNANQKGFLDGIPVSLFAGTYFTQLGGSPDMWPNDGVAQVSSATAEGVPSKVLPHSRCYVYPLTHSLFVSRGINQPDNTSLTWNSDVAADLAKSIDGAAKALKKKNRIGCS